MSGLRTIYGLCDPSSGELRYVGVANDPERRLSLHLCTMYRERSHKANWLRSLGKPPSLVALESVQPSEAAKTEQLWISWLKFHDCRLTNMTDGGEGVPGRPVTSHQRETASAALKGRPRSREVVARYSAWRRGVPLRPETRAKISAALRGIPKPKTEEHRAKIAATLRGRSIPEQVRAKISAAFAIRAFEHAGLVNLDPAVAADPTLTA